MAPGHQGEHLDVQRLEAEQLPRPDEVRGVAVVAAVVDRMADVVQQRGVLERLAGRRRQPELVGGGIEESEGEPGHLAAMGVRAREALRQRLDRATAHAGGVAGTGPQSREVEQQSFAQRPRAGHQLGGAGLPQQEVEQHDRGRHQIHPLGVDPGERRSPRRPGAEDALPQARDLRCPGTRPVQARHVLTARRRRHRDQRADRPGSPDGTQGSRPAHPRQHLAELAAKMLLELADLPGPRRIVDEEAFGQPRHAERQAPHPERAPVADEHELDASAPHIDQQVGAAVETEGVAGGAEDETRLVRTRDDANGDARLPPEQADEGGAVPCLAHRARRHGAQALDMPRARQTLEGLERAKGELRRLAIELAAREGTVAEADHLLQAIDHLDAPIRADVGHEHVQGVGADVDRGQPHRGHDTPLPVRSHVKRSSRYRNRAFTISAVMDEYAGCSCVEFPCPPPPIGTLGALQFRSAHE